MSKKGKTEEAPAPQTAPAEDIAKSIEDVNNQLKVAWSDERRKQLENELERLKTAQAK